MCVGGWGGGGMDCEGFREEVCLGRVLRDVNRSLTEGGGEGRPGLHRGERTLGVCCLCGTCSLTPSAHRKAV